MNLRHVVVDALLDATVFGCEVARGKDHPDIYLEAARRLGAVAVRSEDPCQPWDDLMREADICIDGWEGLVG